MRPPVNAAACWPSYVTLSSALKARQNYLCRLESYPLLLPYLYFVVYYKLKCFTIFFVPHTGYWTHVIKNDIKDKTSISVCQLLPKRTNLEDIRPHSTHRFPPQYLLTAMRYWMIWNGKNVSIILFKRREWYRGTWWDRNQATIGGMCVLYQ